LASQWLNAISVRNPARVSTSSTRCTSRGRRKMSKSFVDREMPEKYWNAKLPPTM
jgi:hypothetical protein